MRKSVFFLIQALAIVCWAQKDINLSGQWEFQLDRNKTVTATQPYDDTIELPGSMPQRLKGDMPSINTKWTGALYDSSYFHNPFMKKYQCEENFKVPFFLTPLRHYVGTAWYRRDVMIPRNMRGKHVVLYLERPHITSTLYINGQEVGTRNSLSVAHEYDITPYITPGKNATLALKINNEVEPVGVGHDSHSVTDQTQGNWNGIVGKMMIYAKSEIYTDELQITPDVPGNGIEIKASIINTTSHAKTITYAISTGEGTFELRDTMLCQPGMNTLKRYVKAQKAVQLWDEFTPNHYALSLTLSGKSIQKDVTTSTFGMRQIEVIGKEIYVNGRVTMMRGTVENCDFPLTGYPPTDRKSWEHVFRKCKEYGLNHMRFHSYCPPEVAFEVADEMGFYLQPEGPSWPNHGVKLGQGQIIDTYLMEETQRMVRNYGNHPSFCMLSAGNEPAGNWVPWVSKFVDEWKATDQRRIYTGASVGGGWAWQPHNQYHVKAGARGLETWKRSAPESMFDFREKIDTISQPFISHETGQWCVFPDLSEVKEYTGVNQARNFEIFQDILDSNGMGDMAHKFMMASGKLQVLCYKAEIERTLRTPGYDGFQLLGLNDYSGQGSAIVGPLNVFFNEKGYVNSEEWREFCSPITVLCRLPRFCYWSGDTIPYSIDIANFGKAPLHNASITITCTDDNNTVQFTRTYGTSELSNGTLPLGLNEGILKGHMELDMKDATHLTMRVTLKADKTKSTNHWDLWLYPRTTLDYVTSHAESLQGEGNARVYICDTLDDKAREVLSSGGKVLLLAAGHITYGAGIQQQFTPVFWNTSWFKMRPPHTTGAYIKHEHSIFKRFPSSYHSDLQWWELLNRQQVMLLDRFPRNYQPVVQSIDTWFLSRKIGMLVEAEVGNGKLLITTMPLNQKKWQEHPVACQMRRAILEYMASEEFAPSIQVDLKQIEELFTLTTPVVNMFTNDSPDELKPKLK